MRIVSWNCQGAFRKKAEYIARLSPDIAIIQECEEPERLIYLDDTKVPTSLLWFGDNPAKGICILSYTGFRFKLDDAYDPTIRHCIPLRVTGNKSRFNLLAIWAMNHESRHLRYIGQVYQALKNYRKFLTKNDTIIAGDFNSNKQWDYKPRIGNHSRVVSELADIGIESAYHQWFNEEQGSEKRYTLYMQRKRNKGYHVDYCFIPKKWISRIKSFSIGPYSEWSELSDHCPIIAELRDV